MRYSFDCNLPGSPMAALISLMRVFSARPHAALNIKTPLERAFQRRFYMGSV